MVFLQELNCIVRSQNCCTAGILAQYDVWVNENRNYILYYRRYSRSFGFHNKLKASYLDARGLNAQRKERSYIFDFLTAIKRPVIQRNIFTLLTTCLFEKELLTRRRFYRLLDTNNIFEKTGQAKI